MRAALAASVQRCLHSCDYTSAIYLCEQYCALDALSRSAGDQDLASTLLLATCYYRSGKPNRAYSVLKGCTSPEHRYLFALCCFELQKYAEAEAALLPGFGDRKRDRDSNVIGGDLSRIPNGAFGCLLMGRICLRTSRRTDAVKYFEKAIELDSFLWGAYEALCELGVEVKPDSMFTDVEAAGPEVAAADSAPATARVSFKSPAPAQAFQTPAATPLGPGAGALGAGAASASAAAAASGTGAGSAAATFVTPPAMPHSSAVGGGRKSSARPARSSRASTAASSAKLRKTRLSYGASSTAGDDEAAEAAAGDTSALPPVDVSAVAAGAGAAQAMDLSDDEATGGGTAEDDDEEERDKDAPPAAPKRGRKAPRASTGGSEKKSAAKADSTPSRRVSLRSDSRKSAPESGNTPGMAAPAKRGGAGAGAPQKKRLAGISESAKGPPPAFEMDESAAVDEGSDGEHSEDAEEVQEPSAKRRTPARGRAAGAVSSSSASAKSAQRQPPAAGKKAAKSALKSRGDGKEAKGDTKEQEEPQQHGVTFGLETKAGSEDPASALRQMAQAYGLQCTYRCKEAVELYSSLPRHHGATGWVLAQLGRCYFEMTDYARSTASYERLRKTEPHRLAGLEYYSTALWHLKKEVELSFLAQQLSEFDKNAAQTWIVVGNCFSLQKEHETALKFFRRAQQVDPTCAYAHTLAAHEHVANEDYDKAVTGFRHATTLDERHYNAWYGLGNVLYRQEKFDVAAYYLKRAIKINDRSSVLFCYLGMVLHASGQPGPAMQMLDRADALEPSNPLIKFQKANVLESQGDLQASLKELEAVKLIAPREASVHFLTGKVYKKLGEPDKAMMAYIRALDLDPKDKNVVQQAIDKLHDPEEEEPAPEEEDGDAPM